MPRILTLIILVYVFYLIFKRYAAWQGKQSTQRRKASNSENIVLCTLCGVRVPENETTTVNQQIICKQQPCKH